ncbi:hypothetical protein D7X87_00745 [bacterium D16-54]|nr:hypothetical protein D7X87_00745 [bacterium D16-54]RKJ16846.1 hypothetical protein D7X65_00745 [bacterium D16-56]
MNKKVLLVEAGDDIRRNYEAIRREPYTADFDELRNVNHEEMDAGLLLYALLFCGPVNRYAKAEQPHIIE